MESERVFFVAHMLVFGGCSKCSTLDSLPKKTATGPPAMRKNCPVSLTKREVTSRCKEGIV